MLAGDPLNGEVFLVDLPMPFLVHVELLEILPLNIEKQLVLLQANNRL